MRKKIIVVDLDGTIADCRHRLHHIEGKKKDFYKFYSEIPGDSVYWFRWYLIKFIAWITGSKIIFSTGRSIEDSLQTTANWLWYKLNTCIIDYNNWGCVLPKSAKLIYMRSRKDRYLEKSFLKMKHLNDISKKYGNVWLFIDDSETVCNMAKRLGILTWNVTRRKYKNSYSEV